MLVSIRIKNIFMVNADLHVLGLGSLLCKIITVPSMNNPIEYHSDYIEQQKQLANLLYPLLNEVERGRV